MLLSISNEAQEVIFWVIVAAIVLGVIIWIVKQAIKASKAEKKRRSIPKLMLTVSKKLPDGKTLLKVNFTGNRQLPDKYTYSLIVDWSSEELNERTQKWFEYSSANPDYRHYLFNVVQKKADYKLKGDYYYLSVVFPNEYNSTRPTYLVFKVSTPGEIVTNDELLDRINEERIRDRMLKEALQRNRDDDDEFVIDDFSDSAPEPYLIHRPNDWIDREIVADKLAEEKEREESEEAWAELFYFDNSNDPDDDDDD